MIVLKNNTSISMLLIKNLPRSNSLKPIKSVPLKLKQYKSV